jgi:hypothetical protein
MPLGLPSRRPRAFARDPGGEVHFHRGPAAAAARGRDQQVEPLVADLSLDEATPQDVLSKKER